MGRLTKYDREQIEHHLRTGLSIRAIARMMGRDHSVIVRELKRNRSPHFAYESSKADYFSQRRAKKTNKRKLLKNEKLYDYVLKCLEKRLVSGTNCRTFEELSATQIKKYGNLP